MTFAQWSDDATVPDWFPAEHPAAPAVVAHGRKGGPTPCGSCHLIGGQGFIGAPDLAGLPAAYITAQARAFRSGARRSAQADGRPDTLEMIATVRKTSDPDLAAAAAYYAGLPRRPWVRVVESDTAPKVHPTWYGWMDLVPGARAGPLAGRIVEVPQDTVRTFISDPHSGLVAYAPRGSLARGAALVRMGGGARQPCAACHGAGLRGGVGPPLAGRSPSYLARQLWDIRSGARGGAIVAPMRAPAKGLSASEITDVAAYLASLDH